MFAILDLLTDDVHGARIITKGKESFEERGILHDEMQRAAMEGDVVEDRFELLELIDTVGQVGLECCENEALWHDVVAHLSEAPVPRVVVADGKHRDGLVDAFMARCAGVDRLENLRVPRWRRH